MASAQSSKVQKVRPWHENVIDEIIASPRITQEELARRFNTSKQYICIIVNSDAFKNRLAERREEIIDPVVSMAVESRFASLDDKLNAVAASALDKLLDKLESPGPQKVSDLVLAAKVGIGDRNLVNSKPAVQNNLYVVHLPSPADSTRGWLENAQGRKTPIDVVDISHSNPEP
jgi:hypothetical protein